MEATDYDIGTIAIMVFPDIQFRSSAWGNCAAERSLRHG
jgi:hypothetical protein